MMINRSNSTLAFDNRIDLGLDLHIDNYIGVGVWRAGGREAEVLCKRGYWNWHWGGEDYDTRYWKVFSCYFRSLGRGLGG